MKKIAVLGAGFYNIRVYEKLRAAGYYTVAIDGNANAPAAEYADKFKHLNFSDAEMLLNFLKNHAVDAIMPINDWGTQSAAKVSKALGLIGISEEAALAATDKGIMRDKWRESGLPNPNYFVFSSVEELQNRVSEIGFPCVIKPTDSGGSGRGISVLQGPEDLEWAYEFAKPFVRNNRMICEGFVEGTELTIESITYKGKTTILAMSDKVKPELRTRVATSLNYPANLNLEQQSLVEDTVIRAVNALGIDCGMAHTEVIIQDMDVTLVETGARGGGGHIFHTIIEAVSGINAPVALAQILTGEKPVLYPVLRNGSVYRFFNPPYGKLERVEGIEEVKKWPGILDIGLMKFPGDIVGDLRNSLERAGHVITSGIDRNAAVALADKAEQAVKFISSTPAEA